MDTTRFKLFIILALCLTSTLSNLIADVEDKADFKEVDYCSTSEIKLNKHSIDYSWTVKGINGYLLDGSGQSGDSIRLSIANLKFHQGALPGNWSITLSESPPGIHAVQVTMAYEKCPDCPLKVDLMTGDLWVSVPWSKEAINFNTANFHKNEVEAFTKPMVGRSPKLELVWQDFTIIEKLVDQFRKNRMEAQLENNSTSTGVWKDTKPGAGNGQMVDEMSFIFHAQVFVSQNDFVDGQSSGSSGQCRLGNAQSQRRIFNQAVRERQTPNLDPNNPLEMTTLAPATDVP